jgi:hypothetical protein
MDASKISDDAIKEWLLFARIDAIETHRKSRLVDQPDRNQRRLLSRQAEERRLCRGTQFVVEPERLRVKS